MEPGKCYIVTEVTSMVYVGRCVEVIGPHTVLLEDAAWVSETGQFMSTFLRDGRTEQMEIEPVGLRCIHWAGWGEWKHPLFKERK
jgi:hypothetical protein